jgi:integrase
MSRQRHRLNARQVSSIKEPGWYSDGGNLGLKVQPSGSRGWTFRFTIRGKAREMGLGAANDVSLAEARDKADAARKLLADGKDPLAARNAAHAEQAAIEARATTFEGYARDYVRRKKEGWRNEKHQKQWLSTLELYAFDKIGNVSLADIDTPMVLDVLNAIWVEKTVTAQRLRGRIETILDAAKAEGKRATTENPARWRGHLQVLLPNPRKLHKISHHPSLEYSDIGVFFERLKSQPGEAALALRFLILCASRTSEVRFATWREIDFERRTWTVPETRMKAHKAHRVPLSQEAISLLKEVMAIRKANGFDVHGEHYIFSSYKPGMPLSNNALLALLERMDFGHITAHGFRSSFRVWVAETTNYPRAVAEAALAHTMEDKTEEAYQRSDLFERRRALMAEWAMYCATAKPLPKAGKVIAIGKRSRL